MKIRRSQLKQLIREVLEEEKEMCEDCGEDPCECDVSEAAGEQKDDKPPLDRKGSREKPEEYDFDTMKKHKAKYGRRK